LGVTFTGYDLLGVGCCSHCQHPLSSLIASSGRDLDQRQFMILVGALGAVLAIALLTSKGT
jgi:hypothetical protein